MKTPAFAILLVCLSLAFLASAQTSLPFTPLSELRIRFSSIITDLKLNIFSNTFSALKCAPNVTTTFVPKENSYLSFYTVNWTLGSSNVYFKNVTFGQYLYAGQAVSLVEKVATFNCQYGGHSELKAAPGRYSFTYTLYDINRRNEIIGAVTFSDQLNCIAMDSGCWAYTKCDYYSTDCKNTFSLTQQE